MKVKWARLQTDHGAVYAWGQYRAFWVAGSWELEYDRACVGVFRTLRAAKEAAEYAEGLGQSA